MCLNVLYPSFVYRFKEKIVTDIGEGITDSYLEWFHSFKNSIDGSDSWFEVSCSNNDYVECNGNLLLRWKQGYKTIFDLLMVFIIINFFL